MTEKRKLTDAETHGVVRGLQVISDELDRRPRLRVVEAHDDYHRSLVNAVTTLDGRGEKR